MCRFPRVIAIVIVLLLLSACGLPLSVQIASLVADGVSLLATDKTITDHGISVVADKDCAVWRGISGQEFCREREEGGTMLAEAPAGDMQIVAEPVETVPLPDLAAAPPRAADGEAFEVAEIDVGQAGFRLVESVDSVPLPELAAAPPRAADGEAFEVAEIDVGQIEFRLVDSVDSVPPPELAVASPQAAARQASTERGGLHFVLASFALADNAERLIFRNPGLSLRVVTAEVDQRTMHRVVVGPFDTGERRALRDRLAVAGFGDAWAIRLEAIAGAGPFPQMAALP